MAFENVVIVSTRNGVSPVSGYRQDLVAGDVMGLSLSSMVGVSSVRWRLIGRPEYSAAGGAGPEPVLLATAPTSSFTVDADVGSVGLDGTYDIEATINPGSPGEVRKTTILCRLSALTISGIGGSRSLRKISGCESLEDTSVPTILQGWATQINRWLELVRQIATGGGIIETLSGAYSVGVSAADQTLALDDSHGGGVVINASGGGFTGASALRINLPSGVPVAFARATPALGLGTAAPALNLHVVAAAPGIRLERTAGVAFDLKNVSDVLTFANGGTTLASMPATGGIRADLGLGLGAAPPTAAALAMGAGSAIAVSLANTGRFRYNEVAQQFEVSQNGGAYTALGGGSVSLLEADGATTGAVPLNTLAFPAAGTVVARLKARRDFVFLDRTSTATVDNFLYFAALGGVGRWVRMRIADPFWTTQTTFFVDPANASTTANDDNTGVDGTHQLRSLSEYHLRLWGAQLPADQTITIAGDLNANDVVQGFFSIARDGFAFTGFPHYAGVQKTVFTGSLDLSGGVVNQSGATSQPMQVTASTLTGTWSNSGPGSSTLVGLVIRRTSDLSTARVVQDLGGKTAWISKPISPTAIPVNWANGDAITVYDVPSLGQQVTTHAGETQFADLKVSGRWMSTYGHLDLYNCTGDVIIDGAFGFAQNCMSGLVAGGSFLVVGGTGAVAGGYHRLICAGGYIRINTTTTVKALQVEANGVITAINGGSQGTADIEFNQTGTLGSINPAINFLGISGGRMLNSGYTYGTINSSNTLINFQGRGQRLDVAHVPTVTGGAGASQITTTQGGIGATNVSVLATRMWDDLAGNVVVGPAGTSVNDNRGQTILNIGSAAGVGTSAVNWNDVLGAVGGAAVSLTPGSVVFANSSGHLAEDNGTFFWDDTHATLSIGSNTPPVPGAAQIGLYVLKNVNNGATVVVENTNTGTSAEAIYNLKVDTGAASFFYTGANFVGTGSVPNLQPHSAIVSTTTTNSVSTYIGSHGFITLQTGNPTQAERVKILQTGEVQITNLAAGGLVKAAAGGQLAIAVAGTDFLAPPGGGVVAGDILFGGAAGALAQDTSLFWDNTNKRLGIGTQIPSAALTIDHNANNSNTLLVVNANAGAAANANVAVSNGTAAGALIMNGTAHPGGGASPNFTPSMLGLTTTISGPNPTLYLGSNGIITMQTGTTQAERIRIAATGLVTIGDLAVSTLTTGGLVKAAPTTGDLGLATPGTDYLSPTAFGSPLTTGLLKDTVSGGSGTLSTAVAGTDYVAPATTLTAGAGFTAGSGGDLSTNRSFVIGANGDGSIAVNLHDIQVGILATDVQHGTRGGGNLHAIATHSVAGFMSAADKANLDGLISSSGVPSSRQLIAGPGMAGGGDLTADRTFTIVAADATITVNAHSIQVGAIGTTNITNQSVTLGKLEPIGAGKILGFDGPGTGSPFDLSVIAPLKTPAGSGELVFDTSFTQGSVVFQGAAQIAQNNAVFFWNDVNHRLGIGTNVPISILDVIDSSNGPTQSMLRNQGAGITALAQFVATNNAGAGIGVAVGVAGSGFTATTNRPLVIAGMPYVVPYFGSQNLYVGAPSTLIFATGATEANRLQILSSGLINVSSLSASGVVQAASSTGQLSTVTMVAGQVPFGAAAGGGLAQDAGLVYDNTNKRLGVGASISSPGFDLSVAHTINTSTNIAVENDSTGTLATSQFIASNNNGVIGLFGATGSGYTATLARPNLGASTMFVTPNNGNVLYLGAVAGITFQAGSPHAEAMRVLSTGEVVVFNKLAGGNTAARELVLAGTTDLAHPGHVMSLDPFGVGRSAGVLGGAPMFAVAGDVSVTTAAGASLDWTVFNTATVHLIGGTAITNAAGFNWVTINPPVYSGTVAIGAGGFSPPAATLCIAGPPSVAGGASFNNGVSLGPLGLWVKASSQIDGSLNLSNNLNMNGTLNGNNAVFIGNVGANGTLSGSDIQGITGRNAASFFVGTSPVWAINATVDVGPSNPRIGFYSATPITQRVVTGSRGGNAALASFLTGVAATGLIVDNSTP